MSKSYTISNRSSFLTLGSRIYHTNNTYDAKNNITVYSLLLSDDSASTSHHSAEKLRARGHNIVNLPVICDSNLSYVEFEESIEDFILYTAMIDDSNNYIIPYDIFKEYNNYYDESAIAKLFLNIMRVHNITNIILPVKWSDYEHYKKVYVYMHYENNRLHRKVYIEDSIDTLIRKYSNSKCYDIEIKILGQAFDESKDGWVVI